jgi:nucleoside-diphosphate-sugar epimerase|tara:strand:+ start:5296 stop:6141 length:846 start_codon:yes stop_codon:yes gene_type:complete
MILITGANGFIGTRLREYMDCITVDYDNCDYNGNLNDIAFVNTLPDVDTIIHLAAFNSTKNFYSTPFSVIDSIVTPTMNLLKRYPTAHFVYASSSEGYASTVNQGWASIPTPEAVALTIEDIQNPRWCYASGKIAMESAVISNSIENNSTYTIIRFHNIYGPGQLNHFIPEFVDRLRQGDSVLYGHSDTRSFCFIDDACELIKRVYNTENEIINIGSDVETTILDVAHQIMELMNIDYTTLRLEDGQVGSTPRRVPDITKLQSLVSNFVYISLKEGLKKCL